MTANKGGAGLIVELTSDVDGIPAGTRDRGRRRVREGFRRRRFGDAGADRDRDRDAHRDAGRHAGADGHPEAAAQAADVAASG